MIEEKEKTFTEEVENGLNPQQHKEQETVEKFI